MRAGSLSSFRVKRFAQGTRGAAGQKLAPTLVADRYHHYTHFTFELLQNAEDALARWSAWQGSRSVPFDPHQKGSPRQSLRPAISSQLGVAAILPGKSIVRVLIACALLVIQAPGF
jgi:hypothetical protein